ncbi:MAG: class I SAM-dependent methyltransferase [Pseudomonadota bacterium]
MTEHSTWLLRAGYRLRRLKSHLAGESEPGRLPFDWSQAPETRLDVVAHAISATNATRYLEIGCNEDTLFSSVSCALKVGVDPVRGGTHRMTSDAFFATNTETFDVVFIDGLHIYDQVRRDIDNALGVLAPGGVIGLHDCLPLTWKHQAVPRQSHAWNGDVWKAVMEFKARDDVDLRVIAIDQGVGVVCKRANTDRQSFDITDWADLPFGVLRHHYKRLGIIGFNDLPGFLNGDAG